jgi:hypothetical protein
MLEFINKLLAELTGFDFWFAEVKEFNTKMV